MRASLLIIFVSLFSLYSLAQGLPSLWDGREGGDLQTGKWGRMTPFWGQEAIGAPEAHRFMAAMAEGGFPFLYTKVAMVNEFASLGASFLQARVGESLLGYLRGEKPRIEEQLKAKGEEWASPEYGYLVGTLYARQTGADNNYHASAVTNLIAAPPPVGVSLYGVISSEIHQRPDTGDLVVMGDNAPDIANVTSIIDLKKTAKYKDLKQARSYERMIWMSNLAVDAAEERTIYVVAAGNDFPHQMYGGEEVAEFINVASCTPVGCISHFSQPSKYVTIAAPSDNHIQTQKERADGFSTFGGTSGATPLVTGALADVISILPYKLTQADLKHMLQKTATTTTIDASDGGAGVLNYYKLIRAAERIRRESNSSAAAVKKLLYEDHIYDFTAAAKAKKEQAIRATDFATRFLRLREVFFLSDADMEVRSMLADMYRQHGYKAQALFYDNPEVSVDSFAVSTLNAYRHDRIAVASIPIFAGTEFSPEFKHYLDVAMEQRGPPLLLETLLSRIVAIDGDLMQELHLDPAYIAVKKPHLFNLFVKHQHRLRPRK